MPAAFHFPRSIADGIGMSEDPFSNLDLRQAIDLRWSLRDIKAKRLLLSPINPSHLQILVAMGLVEMRNDEPMLTNFGLDALL
jgi:hypothetical protein